jgi:hypothetical protein
MTSDPALVLPVQLDTLPTARILPRLTSDCLLLDKSCHMQWSNTEESPGSRKAIGSQSLFSAGGVVCDEELRGRVSYRAKVHTHTHTQLYFVFCFISIPCLGVKRRYFPNTLRCYGAVSDYWTVRSVTVFTLLSVRWIQYIFKIHFNIILLLIPRSY